MFKDNLMIMYYRVKFWIEDHLNNHAELIVLSVIFAAIVLIIHTVWAVRLINT